MPETDFYRTIEKPATAEFKDRGSRFLAYAFPLNNLETFREKWQEIKKQHTRAVHHCFAYRIGRDGTQFRSSDDGEPSGTAGRPILGQIDSRELTDVCIIVTRYFGGTLLGVPGLIQAYKSAASLVLQVVPQIQVPVSVRIQVHFDYTRINDIMIQIKAFHGTIISQEMQLFCRITLQVPRIRSQELLTIFSELKGVSAELI